jgi:predicted phosphodiesterase
MKIAVVSDIHRPHWNDSHFDDVVTKPMLFSLHKEKPDLILDAGDLEYPEYYDRCFPEFEYRVLRGNHDWYGKQWKTSDADVYWLHSMSGSPAEENRTIIATPLWTDLNGGDMHTMGVVGHYLNDMRYIKDFTAYAWLEAHRVQRKFLESWVGEDVIPPDVVMTHHLPSFKSVSERYKQKRVDDGKGGVAYLPLEPASVDYKINYGFASHLDDLVLRLKPKFWIHGHTHIPCDYKLGDTRVICNPCGYPGERRGRPYTPVYIDV